ncbi:MAG: hypothetical protein M1827_000871 [Pycnora praestabilis]|nr:MAG: hypothetical protein M1827_000871 [Pycnora praestabilis]
MASQMEPAYFQALQSKGALVVSDAPKFDLEAYIGNYAGKTRWSRLYLIGTTSSSLYLEALKGAIAEAKRGKDVARYEASVEELARIVPDEPDAIPDLGWMDKMTKQVKAETDRLELELKGYKNNLIKESIRMGNEDLGSFYHDIGDLPSAFKSYARMRDFCTTPKHIHDMCLKLVVISVEQANWMSVSSNVQKIRNLQQKPEDTIKVQPLLCASMGLAQLASGNFKEAATSFLETDSGLGDRFNQVLTSNDVAVYGGLCALASMDRNELQTNVLENSSFRNFLELEPHIRRAISFFCSSKYSQCLEILEAYKTDYLLDLHLQRHVGELYYRVRSKSIVQYFIPFSCVTLDAMAQAFATNERSIEDELVNMIERGTLEARIDTQNRLLTSTPPNTRSLVHSSALYTAKTYEKTVRLRLMRMNILNAGLEVKAPKGHNQKHASSFFGGAGGGGDVFMGGGGESRFY